MIYYSDHLGSLTALTDEDGNVKERQAFDPWGNRRDPDDWTSLITTPVSHITGRGYTMHEHLDDFALINMNGRVYDPRIARFLSPDPQLQAPGYWLNYNRYGYCFNNPLIYSDPSGMRTLFGRFFHWAGTGINNANDWFWDTTNQFGRYLDEMGISVNIEGGYNSAQGAYVESGGYRQYVNQAGVNPADNVNKGIDDARENEAYLQGNTPSLRGLDYYRSVSNINLSEGSINWLGQDYLEFTGTRSPGRTRVDGTLTWYRNTVSGPVAIDSWSARSGSRTLLPTPQGDWSLSNWHLRDEVGFVKDGVGFSVDIKPDPQYGRSYLRIHPDGGLPGTEGCIGLTGEAVDLQRFSNMINNFLQNNETMRLNVVYGLPLIQLYP